VEFYLRIPANSSCYLAGVGELDGLLLNLVILGFRIELPIWSAVLEPNQSTIYSPRVPIITYFGWGL
jgi:hypothetical protein